MKNKIIYIAHRGYSSKYPENTRIAFQKAVEHGFKGVEFDVHITKDRKTVITHDEVLTRMTLGKENRRISEMTLKELRECDMSGEFDVPKQTIMTLEEFCDEFSDKFELIVMELKTDKFEYEDIEKIA
jgi:glycerophosphoryl diester phosphodiesterase